MKNITSRQLIEKLSEDTRKILLETTQLLLEDPGILLSQPAPGKWSVVQVIEHLNTYGRIYLPAIEKAVEGNNDPADRFFHSGWLGGFFTRSMLPKEDGQIKNRMKAVKSHTPANDLDSKPVLEEFIQQQQHLLQLLSKASRTNLNKIKIPISISRWIKLNLGDTFSFLIAHHQRHFIQIRNTLFVVKEGVLV